MKDTRFLLLSALTILILLSGAKICYAGDSVAMVQDQTAKSVIVLAEKPTRSAQIAARELQEHIKGITGVVLQIISEKTPVPQNITPVYVGESSFTQKLRLTSNSFAPQESLIKITDKYIVFIGRDDPDYGNITYEKNGVWPGFNQWRPFYRLGTLYAVYNFLEELCGVRWYMVTSLGTVIPKKKTLAFKPVEKRSKPWTIYRNTSRNIWQIPGEIAIKGKPMTSASVKDNYLFLLRCRLGGEPFSVNHSVCDYYKRFGKKHPEWFVDGKPGPDVQPRFDNPGVIKQIAKDAEEFFQLPYAERKFGSKITQGASISAGDYFSVAPLDHRKYGKNLKPLAQPERKGNFFGNGVYSNYYFSAVNNVAAIVGKKYPQEKISSIAYAGMFEAPDFKLEPNVAVSVCMADGWKEGGYGLQNLENWRTKAKQIFTWEYYLDNIDDFPRIRPHAIAEYIQKLEAMKINGWFSEMPSFWGKSVHRNPALYHLNAYVTYLMLRKKAVDIDQVLDEYYTLFYGPAAKPMAEFWESLEEMTRMVQQQRLRRPGKIEIARLTWDEIASPKKLNKLLQVLNKAEKAAIAEQYAERVQLIRKGVLGRLERTSSEYRLTHQSTPRTNFPRTTQAPIIDGKLNTPEWENAVVIDKFTSSNLQSQQGKFSIYLMHDDNFLYIGSRYVETKGKRGISPTEQAFTFFLDPGRTRRNFFSFAITPDGRFTQKNELMTIKYLHMYSIDKIIKKNPKWSSNTKYAVKNENKEWSAELAIPLKELGQETIGKDTLWGANFVYSSKIDNELQTDAWATGKGGYFDPDNFGIMTFGKPEWQSVLFNFEEDLTGKVIGVNENDDQVLKGVRRGEWSKDAHVPGHTGYACFFGDQKFKRYIQLAPKIGADNFTISFWMKASRQPKGAHLVFSTTSAPYWGAILSAPDKDGKCKLKFNFNAGWKTHCLSSKTKIDPSKWYFITYAINRGRDIRLYVNGELDAIGKVIYLHTQPLRDIVTIGGPYNLYTGMIDSFSIHKGNLSADKIRKLYNKKEKK